MCVVIGAPVTSVLCVETPLPKLTLCDDLFFAGLLTFRLVGLCNLRELALRVVVVPLLHAGTCFQCVNFVFLDEIAKIFKLYYG